MKINNIFWTVASALVFSGCSDYIDIKTQGSLVPEYTENYRYLLNYTNSWELGSNLPDIASDDVELVDGTQQVKTLGSSDFYAYWPKTYTWQSEIYPTTGYYNSDGGWNAMFNTITYANIVISEVPSSKGGTENEKQGLIAEALVHRADAYLMLVNMYAKPYKKETATSDLGLPLRLSVNVSQSLKRNSVQEVYEQILSDLKAALPALPESQEYNTLPSKVSAYGELARTYLYMGDYEKANMYADSALVYRSTINDLSNITAVSSTNYPTRLYNPEILLSKTPFGAISAYAPIALRLSTDLLNLLGTKDKRYTLFTTEASTISAQYVDAGGRYFYGDRALNESRNIGPSVPEMYLIKAEYYARTGNPSKAMEWVNKLRVKRFSPDDYKELTSDNTDDALEKVIDERHREFFCRMLRWWDLRRLKDDARFQKTITRVLDGKTYTLTPTSNRYVFPIASYQIVLNPEMEQNP
ncbi:RagB/SusD family nutrient uptake outer membrane protein [Dysgonomonas capnocytophagoides]|uniref:RagB/SusD family nutrient uptake outer membrane protein n=1 Tax=Dysgonomonas capnocytophagoides TaxID=45254 RepID=UPI00333FA7C1